jgi:hypothetical protein
MSKEKIITDLHYLGVKIEKSLWNKLRMYSSANQDSVGKLVRNILTDWINDRESKIK